MQRYLSGTCEISTGAFVPSNLPPVFDGDNDAVVVDVDFTQNGSPATLTGYTAEMWLDYDQYTQSSAVDMTIDGSSAVGSIPSSILGKNGYALLVVRLTDTTSGNMIVAFTTPILVFSTVAPTLLTEAAPNPSEVVYTGRAPYVGTNNNWFIWDNDQGIYVDSGVLSVGVGVASINGVQPDQQGNVAFYGTGIPMSANDSTKIATAVENASHTADTMTGATSTTDGASGTVPKPFSADYQKFLCADGTWKTVVLDDMTGATTSSAGAHGLVPAPTAGNATRYLRSDATWQEVDLSTKADPVLVINIESFNALPQTVEAPEIKANHVCLKAVLSNPLAQDGEWTVTTADGELEVDGSILDATELTLYLIEAVEPVTSEVVTTE